VTANLITAQGRYDPQAIAVRVAAYRPRQERDDIRADIASQRCRANGGGAMEQALARIEACRPANEAYMVNLFKLRVEHFIELGASNPAVRARFAARCAMLQQRPINGALATVNRWY
jgi:hypothetical protein